jgi:hypothetical protein
MHRLNWSHPRPEKRAVEPQEDSIEQGKRKNWLRVEKRRAAGRAIVLADESGCLLIPRVVQTGAPRGQTPVYRHGRGRGKIRVIAGVAYSQSRMSLKRGFISHTR